MTHSCRICALDGIPTRTITSGSEKDDIDPSGAAVLHHFSDAFFVAAEYTLPILFFSSAILALRYGVLPKWLGWFSALIGIVLLIGPIGGAAFIFATPIWTLIVSIWLWRTTEEPSRAGHAALGATG